MVRTCENGSLLSRDVGQAVHHQPRGIVEAIVGWHAVIKRIDMRAALARTWPENVTEEMHVIAILPLVESVENWPVVIDCIYMGAALADAWPQDVAEFMNAGIGFVVRGAVDGLLARRFDALSEMVQPHGFPLALVLTS